MIKNISIALAAIVVLGLGGIFVYNQTQQSKDRPNVTSETPGTTGSTKGVVDYAHKGLTSVGPNIYDDTSKTQLILSYNKLTSLPSQLGNMDKLQVLRVDHNELEGSLIAEIRKMPLVTLDASHNKMTGIPAEIGQLNHLVDLDYSYNQISTLPNEIANLKQLKTLNLTGNPLTQSQIASLKAELPNTTVIF